MGMRSHIPGARKANIGDAGRVSEKRLATSMKGRLTPASGAMAGAKGDIVLAEYLVEAKSTTNRSMSIQYSWLGKITGEALQRGKSPMLVVSFTDPNGKTIDRGEWVMVSRRDWDDIQDALAEAKGSN